MEPPSPDDNAHTQFLQFSEYADAQMGICKESSNVEREEKETVREVASSCRGSEGPVAKIRREMERKRGKQQTKGDKRRDERQVGTKGDGTNGDKGRMKKEDFTELAGQASH